MSVHPFSTPLLALALCGGMALASVPAPVAEDPVAIIRKKDEELQKLLRDKNVGQKTGQIKTLINGIFDFEELGRRALGTKTWPTLKPDQQKRFVAAFKSMVENSSVKKLEVYQSDSTRYDAPEVDGTKATVTAHVFSKGQESIVTYKLLQKNETWKAWDLIIDDLSTAGNYGDQFRKILQNNNVDQLIAKLEKKAAGDEAKTDNVKASTEKQAAQSAAKAKPAQPAAKASTTPATKPATTAKPATAEKPATASKSAKASPAASTP
jgi:phospholipid transport system substrate-binding protein